MGNNFGDFEEESNSVEEGIVRVRLPRKGEFLGLVLQRLGGNRMEVKCSDGKIRNCRVPGRFKRRFWLRPSNVIIITPWKYDDTKGDIIFQYSKNNVNQLRKKGFLDNLKDDF